MKIFLAIVAGLITGSDGQQFLRTNDHKTCNFSHKAEEKKQSFVCGKTVEIASNNQYFSGGLYKNMFLIKQGHKPLNQTELDSNTKCFEAINVFHDYKCENHPKISLDQIAFMNTLHHQVHFVKNQEA